ncbi:MAG: hypothetical protein ABH881_01805 [bacterium]
MNKKILGMIIIIVAFLLLLGFLYLMFFSSFFKKEAQENIESIDIKQGQTENKQPVNLSANETPNIKKIIINAENGGGEELVARTKENVDKEDLMRMSASFAERFGSYSNQSDFQNIEDLKIFMSEEMGVWADGYIATERIKMGDSSIYYGIVTKAVAEEVRSYDESVMSVLVNTRRREMAASTDNSSDTFSQDILIGLVKENGIWKIDSAFWQQL